MNYRYPLAIDPDEWARVKDEYGLHPDEPVSYASCALGESDPLDLDTPEFNERAARIGDGLHTYGVTLEEVGIELGVCRERARQIEEQALHKLRRAFRWHGFKPEDLTPEIPHDRPIILH